MSNLEAYIYRYHSSCRPAVYFCGGEDNGENLFLGIELEFDTRSYSVASRANKIDLIEKSNKIFNNNTYIYYMNDGSLWQGLEMITQPATYDYHCDNIEKYKQLFNEITEHGFKSQSFQSCGLHIHFNRSYFNDNEDLYTINLLYLVEKFWKDLVLLSRRNYNKIVRWADKYNKKPEDVLEDVKKYRVDRYRAINLTNRDTIEFRIYRGTLNIDDFMATLELTKNLIVASKTKSVMELQQMKFEDLITSENLKRYNKFCHRKSAIDKLPYDLKNMK